jgi:hypothetical protein
MGKAIKSFKMKLIGLGKVSGLIMVGALVQATFNVLGIVGSFFQSFS